MPGAGQLDQMVTLQSPSGTADELGQTAGSWSNQGDVWAQVIETTGSKVPGREFLSGDYRGEEKAVFVIRWRGDVNSTWRLTWNTRVYDIESVIGTQRQGFTTLYCIAREGAN